MSGEFVASFVEDLTRQLQQTGLWDVLFPPDIQALCPAPAWQLPVPSLLTSLTQGKLGGSWEVRWPLLAPIAVLGSVVGLVGWWRLRQGSPHQQLWSTSFLWFALMNATAMPCHNILTPDTLDTTYITWRALDVGCTAAACATAIVAALHTEGDSAPALSKAGGKPVQGSPAPSKAPGRSPRQAGRRQGRRLARKGTGYLGPVSDYLGPVLLAVAVAGNLKQVPWVNEVLYPGLLMPCVTVVGAYTLRAQREARHEAQHKAQHKAWPPLTAGLCVAYLGLVFMLVGLPVDGWLCRTLGPQVTFVHLLFAGCDLAYLGLMMHLLGV